MHSLLVSLVSWALFSFNYHVLTRQVVSFFSPVTLVNFLTSEQGDPACCGCGGGGHGAAHKCTIQVKILSFFTLLCK